MDNELQIDPDILRQTLMQKCANQNMQIVQLEAAVQQLLSEKELLTTEAETAS